MSEQVTAAPAPAWVAEFAKHEPAWLTGMRKTAWDAFLEMPAPKLEKSDLTRRSFELGPFSGGSTATSVATDLLDALKDAPHVILRDGAVVSVQLPAELANLGVVVTDLRSAVQSHADLVQTYLGSVVTAKESKWAALNAAAWVNGVFVYVPKDVRVDVPLHFVYESTSEAQGAAVRGLVVAERGSQVSFAECFVSAGGGDGKVHASVLEVVAQANANVHVTCVNQYLKGPTYLTTRRAAVGNDATVNWVFGDVGDGYTVALVESDLKGSGGQSSTKAVGLGYGRQHMDLTASMLHSGRYTVSDIVMHGVIKGKANSIYRSSTHIFANAVNAGSEQHDRMLILDRSARADAIPMLLIDENDVQRCGHAASVGRIDQNQIYYLMSRGIPHMLATKMIIWGHLQPTLEAIPSQAVRSFLVGLLDREMA